MYTWTQPTPTSEPNRIPSIAVINARLSPKLVRDPTLGPKILRSLIYFRIMANAPTVDKDGCAFWDTKAAVLTRSGNFEVSKDRRKYNKSYLR